MRQRLGQAAGEHCEQCSVQEAEGRARGGRGSGQGGGGALGRTRAKLGGGQWGVWEKAGMKAAARQPSG